MRGPTRLMLVVAVAWAFSAARVRTDDPVTSAVRFNREIIRIVQRKCEPCHAPGGLMMSLSNYRDARAWGRSIREELVEQRMPPSLVAPGYGRFQNDPNLTAREMATLLTWLDGGMPRGEESDLPKADASLAHAGQGAADLHLPLPPQTVPAGEDLVIRKVTVDLGSAAAQRAIAHVEITPGDRRLLRGALLFASSAADAQDEGRGVWLGAWLPWQHAVVPPSSYAFQLPPRAHLVVWLYYRGADADALVDRSAVEVFFAPTTAKGRVDDLIVDAAPPPQRTGLVKSSPGGGATRNRGVRRLMQPTTIWAVHPVVDASVSSLELRAQRPDGSVEVLMWIPKVLHDWPLALVLQDPLTLPAGSVLTLVAELDPSQPRTATPQVVLSVLRPPL